VYNKKRFGMWIIPLQVEVQIVFVHIVKGPCTKGHFIHAGASSGPGVVVVVVVVVVLLLLLLLGLQMERVYVFNSKI
jgi:hypothetical protein